MSLRFPIPCHVVLAALIVAASPLAQAQVYKWVDEKGTVNYGNKPPATARGGKAPTVVEDRVSVYSPDPAVTQATQNARERSALPNTGATFSSQPQPDRRSPPSYSSAPAPAAVYDPCATPGDVNCYAYPGYVNRYRPPQLVQPQLPPGAIAGNVNAGNGYIPGLSSQAQPAPAPASPMMRSGPGNGAGAFGRREDDRGRGR